jgi:hypothetical protein
VPPASDKALSAFSLRGMRDKVDEDCEYRYSATIGGVNGLIEVLNGKFGAAEAALQ